MLNIKCIGVAGMARAGKDTFVELAKTALYKENNISSIKFAFADELKSEVNKFSDFFGFNINPFTNDDKEKLRLRPLLVWWGMERRNQDPEYWIKKVKKAMDFSAQDLSFGNHVFFISDVRFENEVKFIQNMGGKVVHLTRLDENNIPYVPPNKEEELNNPIIRSLADSRLVWKTQNLDSKDIISSNYLNDMVKNVLKNDLVEYLKF